ncbi:MAG: phosphate regulon sensor histidine kinase PhoR [Burkholderiales bacterium]|nr:phosphate regulon sensor histidine kinase PhoR [Burkholderiales bacterium]
MSILDWLWLAVRVLAGAGLGLLAGLLIGRPWFGVALVLGLQLAWQLARLSRVVHWLRRDRPEPAPDFGGLWGELVTLIVRLHRRRQYHKSRLLRLLRELRRSTAAMPDGVVVLNPGAEILWFNRTAGRLLGLRGKTDVGFRVENLVRHPEFVRYLRGGNYAAPVVFRPAAASERYLAIQVVPYGTGQRLMLVRDVTREVRLEALRKDFVANASHELRSPLTVISGYLETLAEDPALGAGHAEPVQEMRRQAERMNLIVRDLLELSRLESSEREIEGARMDVAALIAQLRRDVAARPEPRPSVDVVLESGADLQGDEDQIHSAFRNVLDNALKYTPPEGRVRMRWWQDAAGGHFAVSDTGIGIAPEHIPRLTERFYRVDPGRSRETGGSGLGLAIVKHVLQRHGGWLEIQSVEGQGSTFTCHFPPPRLVASPPATAAPGEAAGTVSQPRRLTAI